MEMFVMCSGVIGFFVVLFSFILLLRYLSYRETMALAEKGLVRPRRERAGGNKTVLVWGVVIAAIGLALLVGLWPLGLSGMGIDYPLGFGPWMLFGLLPLFFGLALILIYVLTREEKRPEVPPAMEPGPNELDQ